LGDAEDSLVVREEKLISSASGEVSYGWAGLSDVRLKSERKALVGVHSLLQLKGGASDGLLAIGGFVRSGRQGLSW
jgi:hypothetical protein